MPSSFTPSLRLTLPVTGENSGTWGDLVNTGITDLVDSSIAGYAAITMTDANYTLTSVNGAADDARKMMLNMSGTLSAPRNVICPTASKLYFIKNATAGGFAITLKTSAGSGISVPNGRSTVLICNGTDVVEAVDFSTTGNFTNISYTGTLTGGTGVVNLGSGQFYKDVSGNVGINTATPGSTLDVKGTLRLSGATSGYVEFAPAAAAGTTTYTLPTADGTVGQVLRTSGAGVLSWVTLGGDFTSSLNIATPNATVPVASLLATNASYANIDAAITPKGNGAFTLQVADNTSTGGNKRGTNAVDLQTSRSAAAQVASGAQSFVAGYANTASNQGAVAMGDSNTASGSQSFAVGNLNTASGTQSFAAGQGNAASFPQTVAIGFSNVASSTGAVAIGWDNTSSNTYSVAFGSNNTASGAQSFVVGDNNVASAGGSATIGGTYGTSRALIGNRAFPSAIGTTAGARQFTFVTLGATTTDTTTTYLTSNGTSSINSATTNIVLANNSAFYFKGEIVAGVTAAGDTKGWTVEGVVKRGATAASIVFVGTPTVTSSYADAGASTWTISVATNTTIGGINVIAVGQTATSIRWVGTIQVVEMSY